MSVHRAAGGDRAVLRPSICRSRSRAEFVAMLDQQPVGALAAVAVALHAHEHPAALQLLAGEHELELALAQLRLGRRSAPSRQPVAAIPQLHGAAAVLALWNRAFEVAVVERMVLDLHREPLVVRIERRPARDGPRLEDAVELQAQVVVQARRARASGSRSAGIRPGGSRPRRSARSSS